MTRVQGISRIEIAVVALAALLGAGLMAFAPAFASEASAARRTWSSTTSATVDPCAIDATPQMCDPAFVHEVRVPRGKVIKVKRLRYTAADTHCSDARIHIWLNGNKIATTDWVKAGEDTTVELLDLTLRRRRQAKAHRFTYKAQGRVGGCNGGAVGSWAGDIKLSGTKRST